MSASPSSPSQSIASPHHDFRRFSRSPPTWISPVSAAQRTPTVAPLPIYSAPSSSPSATIRPLAVSQSAASHSAAIPQPRRSPQTAATSEMAIDAPRQDAAEDRTQPNTARPETLVAVPEQTLKVMPRAYDQSDTKDLVDIISNMLMELIRFNDSIPLRDGRLTRFHSRAPPAISVHDYLQRLTTHATLSPPILLSMVYYIDRLCVLYPAFTISSLTVHRFLIASATVASKGLSDSFWTNNTYARVGGVSLKELALLELEFLWRIEWRIVPKPEVLVDYYKSLVERSDGYEIERT